MDSPRIGLSRAKTHKISLLWLWIFLPHDELCVEEDGAGWEVRRLYARDKRLHRGLGDCVERLADCHKGSFAPC